MKGGAVEGFLDTLEHPKRDLIDAVRRLVARAVPAATEEIKWNAPSFATSEHFATLHLRARQGVLLVLHLGAKPRPGMDMRKYIRDAEGILEWKGLERAAVLVRDAAHLAEAEGRLASILKEWVRHVA